MFQDSTPCLLKELPELSKIVHPPLAAEARRSAKAGSTGLSCFGIDHIGLGIDAPAGRSILPD